MVYSEHDLEVDNMMIFLKQNATFNSVPFASQVVFELKYSEACLESD